MIDVIGIMSGTSLDGLDMAWCRLSINHNIWTYRIQKAETISYPDEWRKLLSTLHNADALTLSFADSDYGRWIGKACKRFITLNQIKPQLIASHGHTIFHRPDQKMTLQIGSGAAIAAETGITTVCDFRSLDVALGGNGAPLVPIGDRLLFGNFSACVNIGGFANISFEKDNHRVAWDICPANFVLNREAAKMGLSMDKSGLMARNAKTDMQLLEKLNEIDYYKLKGPKSLGREWVEKEIMPLLLKSLNDPPTVLRTFTEHIAVQISRSLPQQPGGNALFTGGGVHNTFLMERISALSNVSITIPDKETIDYKEALIFAFLGVLRLRNQNNCLAEVTGASCDNCGGAVFYPYL